MATNAAYVAYQDDPAIRTHWHVITRVWRDAAHATAENTPTGSTVLESGDPKVPHNVNTAMVGWYVNVNDQTVAADLPADESAAAQRAEIESIIREEYRAFDRARFAHADDSTSRPIYGTVAKRTQFLFAALPLNSTDAALDLLKTEARKSLNDFAFGADMSAWAAAFDGGSFYVFTPSTTEDSVTLPAANQGITAPNSAQVNTVSLAAQLA